MAGTSAVLAVGIWTWSARSAAEEQLISAQALLTMAEVRAREVEQRTAARLYVSKQFDRDEDGREYYDAADPKSYERVVVYGTPGTIAPSLQPQGFRVILRGKREYKMTLTNAYRSTETKEFRPTYEALSDDDVEKAYGALDVAHQLAAVAAAAKAGAGIFGLFGRKMPSTGRIRGELTATGDARDDRPAVICASPVGDDDGADLKITRCADQREDRTYEIEVPVGRWVVFIDKNRGKGAGDPGCRAGEPRSDVTAILDVKSGGFVHADINLCSDAQGYD